MPACCPIASASVLFQAFAALDPAAGFEVHARIAAEIVEVSLLVAQEQGNAIVAAGDDQRNRSGGQTDHAVAAQRITQQDRVVFRLVHGVQHLLEPRRHARLPDVVQALGQELQVDLVGERATAAHSSRKRISQAISSVACSSLS